jgi:hypothetical protein
MNSKDRISVPTTEAKPQNTIALHWTLALHITLRIKKKCFIAISIKNNNVNNCTVNM